jgi:predicted DNA-binding protein
MAKFKLEPDSNEDTALRRIILDVSPELDNKLEKLAAGKKGAKVKIIRRMIEHCLLDLESDK